MPSYEIFNADVSKNQGYSYTTNAPRSSIISNAHMTAEMLDMCDYTEKRVLDIGCGDGTYTVEICKRGHPREIIGIDPAEKAISMAQQRYADDRLSFATGDALNIDYPDDSFDIAVIRGVLHHLNTQDVTAAIGEALRIAPTVVILEPNGYSPILRLIEKISTYHREHGEKSYLPNKLIRWARDHGGQITEQRYSGLVPVFCPAWIVPILNAIEPVIESIPLLRNIACGRIVLRIDRPKGT